MKFSLALCMLICSTAFIWLAGAMPNKRQLPTQTADTTLLKLSGDLLLRVKLDEPADSIFHSLSRYSTEALVSGLNNDNARKTFWINIYNACFQMLAKRGLKNPVIFKAEAIRFTNMAFSLDDIEHGILRKYRWKYSLGYWPQFWPGKTIKQLAVDTIDYRIHFALNCGARSCPPIAFYKYKSIDKQLDIVTRAFLGAETKFDDEKKIVHVTKIMQWFKGDFGGERGIRKTFSTHLQRNISSYKIEYQEYDWTAVLNNYAE
jgi:hypothetical protein